MADAPAVAESIAAVEAPAAVKAPVLAEAVVFTEAPVVAEAAPAPTPAPAREPSAVAPITAPVFDPKEYVASVGLQLVETRGGAAHPAEPEVEAVKLGRPRRERPRQAADESLVQVETHNK